jgi:cytochrome c-type biogenesis protein CcmH
MVMAGKGTVSAPAMKLFADTLASYPFDHKARYYLGLAKAQSGDLRGALQDWIDLGMLSPPGAPWMETVNQQIKGISGELGIDPAIIKPSPKVLALSRGPSPEDVKAAEQMSADDRQKMIRSMVQRLADRLAENPDDLAGWQRLAKAYEVLGEAAKAEEVRKRIEAMALKAR